MFQSKYNFNLLSFLNQSYQAQLHLFKQYPVIRVHPADPNKQKQLISLFNCYRQFVFINVVLVLINLIQTMYFNNTLNSDPHTFNQYKPNPCNFNDLQAMIAHFSQPIFKKPLNPQSIVIDSAEGKGKWTVSEQKCYIKFIQANMEEMRCRIKRKSEKVFLQMSKLVKTRSADQCRSHHQKILKYHQNLQEIIRFYTEEMFGETVNNEVKKDAMSKQATTFEIKDDLYTLFQDGNKIKLQINCDLIDEY